MTALAYLLLWLIPPDLVAERQDLRALIAEACVGAELLDPREVRYVLVRPEDIDSDLAMLHRRLANLQGAPYSAEAERFPERTVVNDFLAFNRSYRLHILTGLGTQAEGEALREIDQLYDIWDTVRDARCEYYYVTVRRQALLRLRDLVGAEAFATGQLPPYVPLWRFREIE